MAIVTLHAFAAETVLARLRRRIANPSVGPLTRAHRPSDTARTPGPGRPSWGQLLAALAVIGPGLITGAAGDDAGGIGLEDYPPVRTDVVLGSVISDLIAAFIIICTAATLFLAGVEVATADDAARALEPLAGSYARVLFGVGLFGASMLAASVLPLSTAYAICGAFGWERGVSYRWSEAPAFNGLYTALIALAAIFVLVPGLPLIQVIVATQTLNGLLLPVVLVFIVRLANDRAIMQGHTNGRIFNVLAYGTTAVLILLTVALLATSAFGVGG